MTLAVDLLNPSAEYEAKQYKLKRLVQSPNSYFMDVKCPGQYIYPFLQNSIFILLRLLDHLNSCKTRFYRLFRHHHRLLARSNRCRLPIMHKRALPAHWWKGKTDRGYVALSAGKIKHGHFLLDLTAERMYVLILALFAKAIKFHYMLQNSSSVHALYYLCTYAYSSPIHAKITNMPCIHLSVSCHHAATCLFPCFITSLVIDCYAIRHPFLPNR
ncbi:hypothetical protein CVT24_004758 [Panaeolus cyanescens]|uniref:Uncharacterized protein n=1 Tax=Panaeolus cyanescens TaxID=181874 RepID=A0A409VDX1_9AGAR|nr:hypothetical protein CVT24_004758 [Panaeolus cyanescens]